MLCRNAYGDKPPEVVEPIRAVPDFSSWLVEGGKVDVTGYARRVPDVDRPHRFEITATPSGVAGSRGAETNYKNLAADEHYMNVVDGVLEPLQWLRSMPSAAGPQVQEKDGVAQFASQDFGDSANLPRAAPMLL